MLRIAEGAHGMQQASRQETEFCQLQALQKYHEQLASLGVNLLGEISIEKITVHSEGIWPESDMR